MQDLPSSPGLRLIQAGLARFDYSGPISGVIVPFQGLIVIGMAGAGAGAEVGPVAVAMAGAVAVEAVGPVAGIRGGAGAGEVAFRHCPCQAGPT